MFIRWSISFAVLCIVLPHGGECLLYPRESEVRDVKDLSGRWKFRIDDSPARNQSFVQKWWNVSFLHCEMAMDMPVPSSYNDITQNRTVRDLIGWAWYQREFYVPSAWQENSLVWLRVGSAHYYSIVWINSVQVVSHEGGHLPFEAEVGRLLHFGTKNIVTIAVNNTLTPNTIPPGTIRYENDLDQYPPGYFTQDYQFDFFNYAGIHRPVKLYTTPKKYIKDVTLISSCDTDFKTCTIKYNVLTESRAFYGHYSGSKASEIVAVSLVDVHGNVVASQMGEQGQLIVDNPRLWWPVGMNGKDVAYLYMIVIEIVAQQMTPLDVYRLPYGIRTVEVVDTQFLINGKPFYFLGVGKHEDWDIRGKGFDWANVIKDFNLLEWIGANSFRTSHYPYAEEIMQLCDERGIVVVDECPAVGLAYSDNFVNKTLTHHLEVMNELIARDKNHPSVVMWSVANEPKSSLSVSEGYFKAVIEHTRTLDSTRPVTFVCNVGSAQDLATAFVDVVSVNKYESWYQDSGHTELIQRKLGYFLNGWYEKRKKPVIHMEWGAGVIAGIHSDPAVMFTEEYLEEVMQEHFKVFNSLRDDFLVGEMIWNFADFATKQGTTRMAGNKKGIFTRQRNPKSAAFLLKSRYHSLRNQSTAIKN